MANKFQPWLIWFTATIFVAFQFLLQTSTSVMIPAFMRDFQINSLQVGLLSSSYFYSYLTLQIPAGMLVDRFGARWVLSVGIVLCTIACWLFAHATNFYLAQFSRILMGLGSAPVIGATFALVSHWFPSNRFALIIGLTDTLGMMGGVTGQAYLAHWVENIGWRGTMFGCFIAAIFISLLVILCVRAKPRCEHSEPILNPFKELGIVIRSKQIWLNGIYVAMIWGVAIGFTGLWSVPFLQAQFQLSLTTAATASSMVFVGIAAATPITGWLVDNMPQLRKKLMLGWTLIGLTALITAIYYPQLPLFLVFTALFIFGCSTSSYIISFAFVRESTSPASRATAMSFTNMMSILIGSPLLQPLIGFFLKTNPKNNPLANHAQFATADFKTAFLILPLCLVVAGICIAVIKPSDNGINVKN